MLKKILKVLIGIVVITIIALLIFVIVKYCVIEKNLNSKETEKKDEIETSAIEEVYETEESITKIYVDEPEEDMNVSLDAAKVIVCTDAEPDLSEVEFTKTELEEEDGFYKWIISFKTHNVKYDYVVSAYDGRIIEKSSDKISQE